MSNRVRAFHRGIAAAGRATRRNNLPSPAESNVVTDRNGLNAGMREAIAMAFDDADEDGRQRAR